MIKFFIANFIILLLLNNSFATVKNYKYLSVNSSRAIDKNLLIRAVRNNDIKLTKKLLKNKSYNINAVDRFGNTALYYANNNNNYNIAKFLLKNKANPYKLSQYGVPTYCYGKKSRTEKVRGLFKQYSIKNCKKSNEKNTGKKKYTNDSTAKNEIYQVKEYSSKKFAFSEINEKSNFLYITAGALLFGGVLGAGYYFFTIEKDDKFEDNSNDNPNINPPNPDPTPDPEDPDPEDPDPEDPNPDPENPDPEDPEDPDPENPENPDPEDPTPDPEDCTNNLILGTSRECQMGYFEKNVNKFVGISSEKIGHDGLKIPLDPITETIITNKDDFDPSKKSYSGLLLKDMVLDVPLIDRVGVSGGDNTLRLDNIFIDSSIINSSRDGFINIHSILLYINNLKVDYSKVTDSFGYVINAKNARLEINDSQFISAFTPIKIETYTLIIKSSYFNKNRDTAVDSKTVYFLLNSSIFNENSGYNGGAISAFQLRADNSLFENNTAKVNGGAIHIMPAIEKYDIESRKISYIQNSSFINNKTTSLDGNGAFGGGAISFIFDNNALQTISSLINISNSIFNSNQSSKGGAIFLMDLKMDINNSKFISNEAKGSDTDDRDGGAIYFRKTNSVETKDVYLKIENSSFISNSAQNGGAIANILSDNLKIDKSHFSENKATKNGGAISNLRTYFDRGLLTESTIIDSIFLNNKSGEKGGAIYNSGSTLNIIAQNFGVLFDGNIMNDGKINKQNNAIYQDESATITGNFYSILNLNANLNKNILFNDSILSNNVNNKININNSAINSSNKGFIIFNDVVDSNTITLYDGKLGLGSDGYIDNNNVIFNAGKFDIANNEIGNANFKNLNLNGEISLGLDVDLLTKKMDNIKGTSIIVASAGKFKIDNLNIIGEDPKFILAQTVIVPFDISNELKGKINNSVTKTSGKLFNYDVLYDSINSLFTFTIAGTINPSDIIAKSLSTGKSIVEILEEAKNLESYGSYGNSGYKSINSFNPSLFKPLIALQNGLRLTYQINSNVMNRVNQNSNNGYWVSSLYSDSDMKLKNITSNSSEYIQTNGSYKGAITGFDINLNENFMLTPYFSYINSQQKYNIDNSKNSFDQNLLVGGFSTLFKYFNFFSIFNINYGHTILNNEVGKENFNKNDFSLSMRTGYDLNFLNNLTLRPSLNFYYLYSNISDYENNQDTILEVSGFNSYSFAPQLELIFDLRNNLNIYFSSKFVMNYNTETEAIAENVLSLPIINGEKYYQDYSIGLTKTFLFGVNKRNSFSLNINLNYSNIYESIDNNGTFGYSFNLNFGW